jgi:molybdopterin-guanine dinucleotide biosynthesis protein A
MSLLPVADVTAFILAGGNSTRMGTDKAFVMLDGRTLLARALDVCRTITSQVRIAGDRNKFAPFAPVVEDVFPGCGPLAGIHAALRASQTDWNVVLAVDLPFVSSALLHFLVAQARDGGAVVTVPRLGKGWQPLCAVYRRAFADVAETALHAGRFKIDALFDQALTRPVEEVALRSAGFSSEAFRNLNTPEELAEARKS